MAKARRIEGLDPALPVSHNLPLIFSMRIAELWSLARHLPFPERVHELHDMRIAAKRLRYCFEFMEPCFGKRLKEAMPLFKRLQDYLGEIHDCDAWMDYLRGELARAFRGLERRRRKLYGHVGADEQLGRRAGRLADELTGPALGIVRMIEDVVERRSKLYAELAQFWSELEARDFRGELLRAVAESSGAALPVAAPAKAQSVKPAGDKPAVEPQRKASARRAHKAEAKSAAPPVSAPSSGIRAALDLGSNSIKLLVADVRADGHYTVLADQTQVTGLGRGVSATGALDAEIVARTLEVATAMVEHARGLGAASIVAAGTAAMRSASNPDALLEPLRALGVDVRVISGDEEAQLGRAVALAELGGGGDVVLFDTGGGSTELSWTHDGELRAERSVPLGARRLTELAEISHPVSDAARRRLTRLVRSELAGAPHLPAGTPVRLAGLGGTATALVWMLRGERGEEPGDPNGTVLKLAELRRLQAALARQSMDEVLARPHLDPLRADVIYAGTVIIVKLLEHYGAAEFTVVDRGLRYGLLLAG